jgi:hypothetical protein
MLKKKFLFVFLLFCTITIKAQDTLPDISVKNLNGQIIVSWINSFNAPVSNLSIQRSYDSVKNYTTIGSVLNPQNNENGYADANPPYSKMYYRVFISYEGGTYSFSKIKRPVKAANEEIAADSLHPFLVKGNWAIQSNKDGKVKNMGIQPKSAVPAVDNIELITYPSHRIYMAKDNNIIINLPDAENKKYTVKFFTEDDTPLFELNKIKANYLIVEKVKFIHSGWFHFEVYENGKRIEKNKFLINKEVKN